MLDILRVTKKFHANTVNEKTAIDNLSLHLDEGDFVTVIGGNGAGKSTLLNLIAGAIIPDEGNIVIGDTDVTRLAEHKRAKYVARVFQDTMKGTAGAMNIEDNLALAQLRGCRRTLKWNVGKADREKFKQLVATLDLGLEKRMSTKVNLLSGGQRQALTLLMATINKPRLLLLDEHTAALDPKTAAKVLDLTEKITSQNNQTTVMVTHNMRDAITYGNKLIMMCDGKIVYSAAGEEKKKLTVADLLQKFQAIGSENDRIMLSFHKSDAQNGN